MWLVVEQEIAAQAGPIHPRRERERAEQRRRAKQGPHREERRGGCSQPPVTARYWARNPATSLFPLSVVVGLLSSVSTSVR